MPKAKRNAHFNRVARRQVATSDNLPSPATRKSGSAGDGVAVQTKKHDTPTPSLYMEKTQINNNKTTPSKLVGKKNATTDDANNNEPDTPSTQALSRGQRKRQAKRDTFLKKEKMIISSLMLRRQDEQKKRIDGLDAIKQALMDTSDKDKNVANRNSNAIQQEVQHVSTNKAKRKLVAKEVQHMNLILQHPAFKKDPFETMQEHLRNSFVEDRKQQEINSKQRTEQDKKKTEAKRVEKNGIKKKSQKKKYKPRRTK